MQTTRRALLGAGMSSIKSLDCLPWSFRGLESSRREIKIKKSGCIWENGKSQCQEETILFSSLLFTKHQWIQIKKMLHTQNNIDAMHSCWRQQKCADRKRQIENGGQPQKKLGLGPPSEKLCHIIDPCQANPVSRSPLSAPGFVHDGWLLLDYDFKSFWHHHAISFLFHWQLFSESQEYSDEQEMSPAVVDGLQELVMVILVT